MNKSLLLILLFTSTKINAQQTVYYQNALGKNGVALQDELHNIIKNHNYQIWPLWSHFYNTDEKSPNQVWDIYSDIPGGTPPYTFQFGADECGTYNQESDCYNHEHVWPKTYFGGDVYPMRSDLHHLLPTDGWVNNKHSNLPFGKVSNTSWTSQNGSKLGSSSSYSGWGNDVFEPIDSFKGDIARIYFYMATRYKTEDAGWQNWPMANQSQLTSDAIALLLNWHQLDPVSQKEIDRNDAVFGIQNNRNPFVDYPIFADCIWGTADCKPLSNPILEKQKLVFYPNPANDFLVFKNENDFNYSIFSFDGKKIEEGKMEGNKISIGHLQQGNYFLNCKNANSTFQSIFIKKD